MRKSALLFLTVLSAGALLAGETLSSPVSVNTDALSSLMWRTVSSDSVGLFWTPPTAAVSSKLTIAGIRGEKTMEFDAQTFSYNWVLPECESDAQEDVYTVRLEFFDENGRIEGETLEASGIGRVCGVGLNSAITVIADGTDNRRWSRTGSSRVVVPLWDHAVTAVEINGVPQTVAAVPGWLGFVAQGGKEYSLSLVSPFGLSYVELMRMSIGTRMVVR